MENNSCEVTAVQPCSWFGFLRGGASILAFGEYISHPQECSGQSPIILPSDRNAAHPHSLRVPQSQLPSVFPQFVNGLQISTWREQLQQHCGISGSSKKHRTIRFIQPAEASLFNSEFIGGGCMSYCVHSSFQSLSLSFFARPITASSSVSST